MLIIVSKKSTKKLPTIDEDVELTTHERYISPEDYDYADSYILVKGTITITGEGDNAGEI